MVRGINKLFLLHILFLSQQLFPQDNNAPELTSNESQFYCPGSEQPIVTDFNIQDNGENTAKAVYIQISSGYDQNIDKLIFRGNKDKINASWSTSE
ncbi:MAG: hypothetical protein CND43_00430, partial [Flavobacteriales bacterium MED-G15]